MLKPAEQAHSVKRVDVIGGCFELRGHSRHFGGPQVAVERISAHVVAMALWMIRADQIVDKGRPSGLHRVRIIAHHEHLFDVAA
ncbi:MAG: hypothetical protein ABIR77_05375 [Sphingomicrobium sp.]